MNTVMCRPLTLAILGTVLGAAASAASAEEINALVWCDHTDPAFLEPFTAETGIAVNVRDFEGTGTALALIEQSQPGDWDVFVVDSTDVHRVVGRGLLAPMDPADYPLADIPEAIRAAAMNEVDGTMYAVTEKFGYNAIAYDGGKVDPEAMRDATLMWDPAYAGRIAIYDYYLPIIAQVGLTQGIKPQDLTVEDLPAIREILLRMKENAALVSDVVTSQTALATGEVDILVGGGEYVTATLKAENPALDWVLPKQGGVRWQQSIAVFADSTRKDAATRFIQYVLSPEGQARLATSSCYWGMPANAKATLTDEEKAVLRWDEQPGFIANSYPYPAPTEELDQAMQDLWTEVLAH